jgi:hypothetical protein
MKMMRNARVRGVTRRVWISVAMLCSMVGKVAGQKPTQEISGQEAAVRRLAERTAVVAAQQAHIFRIASLTQNVPQDVRIMQTIVHTALSEVEAPELPKEMTGDSTTTIASLPGAAYVYTGRRGSGLFGDGDVSGFYMKGYGYLFMVHWPVTSLPALMLQTITRGERGSVRILPDTGEPSPEVAEWADQYRQRLSDALRDAIAGYGSTLRRAAPGESITFIADFGNGDDRTVTMTVKAGALHGSDVQGNRTAVQVSTGRSATSGQMSTQLKIMSQIIDTSLRDDADSRGPYALASVYFGGSAEPQYVPGYGVLFRKNARMSTGRVFADMSKVGNRRGAIDSVGAAAQEDYRAHLDTLRQKTAEILATYGPTLTEMKDDDWVGLYFDVGSAAALLNGGTNDYLVQARMRDVRQAASQSRPAAWLEQKLVTNEGEE